MPWIRKWLRCWLPLCLALVAFPAFGQFGDNAAKIRGKNVCNLGAITNGQVIAWNTSAACFSPVTPTGGTVTSPFSCTVSAASSVVCTHNLGTSEPWVACYDGSGNLLGGAGASTSVTGVVANSSNVATISFSGSTTGSCLLSTGGMGPTGATGATGATGPSGGTILPTLYGGRLTLTSGVPVTTSDVVGASTIYYSAFSSQFISLYTGSVWQNVEFTNNTSLTLSGLTSATNYDVFGCLSGSNLALELSAAWTNATTRSGSIVLQDGVQVNSSDKCVLLGTIRTTGTTTTEDSGGGVTTQTGGKRFVWNAYNRVPRSAAVIDATNNWSYNTATTRPADGAAGNQVQYVSGQASSFVDALLVSSVYVNSNSASAATQGIGLDSTTVFTGMSSGAQSYTTNNVIGLTALYRGYPGLGYHALTWLENGGGAGTVQFISGSAPYQSGLTVRLDQ